MNTLAIALMTLLVSMTGCTVSRNNATSDDAERSVYVNCWKKADKTVTVWSGRTRGRVVAGTSEAGVPVLAFNTLETNEVVRLRLDDKYCVVIALN